MTHTPVLSMHTWVSLPNEVRFKIRMLFGIPRSSNTHVDDGIIITDGVTNEDLMSLTIAKMQKYLGEDSSDFHKLFDNVVGKVNDELYGRREDVSVSADTGTGVTIILDQEQTPKKRGRPAKVAK